MEGSVLISHRSKRRVSLAVLLIDDLTGMPVRGSNARAWIEGEKPPIKKNDGWSVFTDLCPGSFELCAEGGHYIRQQISITIAAGEILTRTIRLKPARTYPVPPGCLRIEGRSEPGAEITVYAQDKQSAFKLLADAKQGSTQLQVFHADTVNLSGSLFRLITSDGESENVTLESGQPGAENTYELKQPLEYGHPRVGTSLIPASSAIADENGRFFLVLKRCPGNSKIICRSKGTAEICREYENNNNGCLCPELIQV